MGVDGGYTQTDVEEVSRAFTGWTLAGRGGDFRFDPTGHDFGAKTLLGIPLPTTPEGAGGVQDGENVLEILLAHQSTARFIAWKMIRWLLRYDPPEALVDTVAATFTRTGGDVRSMIRDVLSPENLREAPAKYRQPYQLALAQLRATRPTGEGVVAAVNRQLPALGQPLFQWEDPDGYPDRVDWWGGMILQRWNFSSFVTGRRGPAFDVDVRSIMAGGTPEAVVDAIDRRAFGGRASPELEARLRQYLARAPITETTVREAFALALSSNEFQWY